MVGFFYKLRVERAIAARCEDSLSVRAFLGYGLEEHAHLQQSERDTAAAAGRFTKGIFEIMFSALKRTGFFPGRHLGIDTSTMEANANRRILAHEYGQADWEHARYLASEEGIDPEDEGVVRRFDKKRPGRRTSN